MPKRGLATFIATWRSNSQSTPFGVNWGLEGIFRGQAIVMLGRGLGSNIMVGFVNVFGSPVPLTANWFINYRSRAGLTKPLQSEKGLVESKSH